jgi:lactate dehydrogenase-like 2-hydroxyacid dehydrogenase
LDQMALRHVTPLLQSRVIRPIILTTGTQVYGCEVHGSTLGIIGMGRIGQAIAKRAAFGFGMKIVYHNRSRLDPATEQSCQAVYATKADLLAAADHVILTLPYTPASRHTIAAHDLSLMKPTATLINIARGGIVDDAALAAALHARSIAAAGLDVKTSQPSTLASFPCQTSCSRLTSQALRQAHAWQWPTWRLIT